MAREGAEPISGGAPRQRAIRAYDFEAGDVTTSAWSSKRNLER